MRLTLSTILIFCFFGFVSDKVEYQKPFQSEDFIRLVRPFGKQQRPPGIFATMSESLGEVYEVKKEAFVLSIQTGRVIGLGNSRSYGQFIIIEHKNQIKARYYHLSKILVKENQLVDIGDVIGKSGDSGRTTVNSIGIQLKQNENLIKPSSLIK